MMSSKKRTTVIIIVIIAALAIGIAAFAIINSVTNAGKGADEGSLSVIFGGQTKVLSPEDIRAFEPISAEVHIKSSSTSDTIGTFTGANIADVLSAADPAYADAYTQAIFRSSDGYTSSMDISELTEGAEVMIAYLFEGKEITDPKIGGPLRIIFTKDEFGTRSVKMLTSIELK